MGSLLYKIAYNFQIRFKQQYNKMIVQDFLTHQFLDNLKEEIINRTKPNKSILEALKYYNTINQTYKKEIIQLKNNLNDKNKENEVLLSTITSLKSTKPLNASVTPDIHILSPKKDEVRVEIDESLQLFMMKERVKHLEQYKELKQSRFAEMIQRQAKFVGQINILKYKNQSLRQEIKSLEESLKFVKTRASFKSTKQPSNQTKNKIINTLNTKITSNSEDIRSSICQQSPNDKFIDKYLNPQEAIKINNQITNNHNNNASPFMRNSSVMSVDLNIITSNCNIMNIAEEYQFQNIQNQPNPFQQLLDTTEINEIDNIIAEQLPYVNSDLYSELQINESKEQPQLVYVYENLNNSQININLNQNEDDNKFGYI